VAGRVPSLSPRCSSWRVVLLAVVGKACFLLPQCSPWRVALLAVAGKHGSLWPRCSPREQAYTPWRVVTVGCHENPIFHPKIPILNPQSPNLIPRFTQTFSDTKRDSKPYEIWAKTSFKPKIPIWPIFVNTHKYQWLWSPKVPIINNNISQQQQQQFTWFHNNPSTTTSYLIHFKWKCKVYT